MGNVTYLDINNEQKNMKEQCANNLTSFYDESDENKKVDLAHKVFSYCYKEKCFDFTLIKGIEFLPELEYRFYIHYLGSCDCEKTCKNFNFSKSNNMKNIYLDVHSDIIDTIIIDADTLNYTRDVYKDLFENKCKTIKTETFCHSFSG